ncbi:methyl-accepting chemotaxis protein [Desulfogranum japonicum]|uniref:methyl-accepting chemotaxis protein n=1 Tax=Desulfogranum japonicum TaxID=231447 RepID=UPI0004038770|nr:methyl-accepting chemotaxis protein [Desulfogranum japonicum]
MQLPSSVSLRFKILGLSILPVILLCPIFLTLYHSGIERLKNERNREMGVANTIALNSVLDQQKIHLDKSLTSVLLTDELVSFALNPQNKTARMILEGLYLSMAEEEIARFSVYSADKRLLLEQLSEGLPRRPQILPPELHQVFNQSAADFAFHHYFRGTEAGMQPGPTEYCMLSSITNDDDELAGYVELSIRSSRWTQNIAELTGYKLFLYDPVSHTISIAQDQALSDTLIAELPKDLEQHSFIAIQTSNSHFLANKLSLHGVDGNTVGNLFIVADETEFIAKEQKRWALAIGQITVVVVLILGLALLFVSRNISRPIEQIIPFAEALSRGDASTTLNINAKAEIGAMASALNTMAQHIRERANQAREIAGGNLTVDITQASENDILGESLQAITRNLGHVIEQIQENAKSLVNVAGQVTELSGALQESTHTLNKQSQNMGNAFASIEQSLGIVVDSTEEMSTSIREISRSSNESNATTLEAMEFSSSTSTIMHKLSEVVADISKANQAISDFADQTNLLALNATIEAARAGDAGKGFAVVATEVKELAHRSLETAKNINADITNIEQISTKAVTSTDSIGEVITLASQAAQGIAAAVEEQSAVAVDIAENITNAHGLITGFSSSMDELGQVAAVTDNTTASLNASADQLVRMAEDLQKSIERFKL